MNESEFEAKLKADGYTELERQTLEPRPGKGRHRHHFAVRGLVLSGTFLVTRESEPVTFAAGEIFSVPVGELHDESIGPDGARVLVGRKFAEAKQ
jgi:quercetin dioxygenase-like cupin family protein